MRIHLVAGVLAGSFAALAPLSPAERGLLVICTALVISAEAANTALEALVDLRGGPPTELARLAKDAAAGAVLVLAAASVTLFAIIAADGWRETLRTWRTLVTPAVAGGGIAAVTTLLLVRDGALGRAATPLVAIGVTFVTLLAIKAACPVCAFVPAAIFVIAAAASRRGGMSLRR